MFNPEQNRLVRSVLITEIAREIGFLKSLKIPGTWANAREDSERQIERLSECLAILIKEVDRSEPIPLRSD